MLYPIGKEMIMKDGNGEKPWLASYDNGVPATMTYPSVSYAEFVRDAFERLTGRTALHYMGRGITFGELDALSNRLAHFLLEAGSVTGDFVAVHTPNIPACYISLMGIQKAGCVYQGLSPLLTPEEIEYQLNDSGAKVLVTLDLLFEKIESVIGNTGVRTVVVTSIADYLPLIKKIPGLLLKKIPTAPTHPIARIRVIRYGRALQGRPANLVNVKVDPESPCVMVYTGGTTGRPKGPF